MQPIVTDRVVWSVGLSVCHTTEPCKNGCTDRDAVGVDDLVGPREPCIRWGPDPPWEGAIWRGKGVSHTPTVKYYYRDTPRSSVQKRLNRSRCRLGSGLGLAHGITNNMEIQISQREGAMFGEGKPIVNIGTFCRELWKSRRTDRFVVWARVGPRKHMFNRILHVAPV